MGRMKMCSQANTINLQDIKSRGLRASPPEEGAGGTRAARQAGEGGWMEMRAAQQPDDYPSRGVSSQGTGGGISGKVVCPPAGPILLSRFIQTESIRLMCAMIIAWRECHGF